MHTLPPLDMRVVSLRRLLSKLTVLALSASPAAAATDTTPDTDTCPSCQVSDDADFDSDLPIDREHIEPHDAAYVLGRGLAKALSEMRPLSAIHLSTTWALSPDPLRRAAIAHALEWSFPLLPDALILDHLSRDTDPLIRAACARSAWSRRTATGRTDVLARLAGDSDPEVRAIAARAR